MHNQGGHGGGFGAGANARKSGAAREVELEGHIHAVASILDMQPTDVASALSGALHKHVAPASVSSLSSSVSESASSVGAAPTAAQAVFDSQPDSESGMMININLRLEK